jgi:hypothetical protein
VGIATTRFSRNGSEIPVSFAPSQNRTFGQATINLLSFELDIWGRLDATEAARASLLSAEENRKAVTTTLVATWPAPISNLRALDYQLEISGLRSPPAAIPTLKKPTGRRCRDSSRPAPIRQLVYSAAKPSLLRNKSTN